MIQHSSAPANAAPGTRAALRRAAWVRWPVVVAVLACAPVAYGLMAVRARVVPELENVVVAGAEVAGVVFVIGVLVCGVFGWLGHRKRKVLRRYSWQAWPVRYLCNGGDEWIELIGASGEPVSTLQLSTWPTERGKLVNLQTRELWFAGDPRKYGVVSRPGGADLRYAFRSTPRLPAEHAHRPDEAHAMQTSTDSERRSHRADLQATAAPAAPKRHGGKDDAQYPSPRLLRRCLAFLVDWIVHVGCGIGAAIAVSPAFAADAIARQNWQHTGVNPVVVFGFFLVASAIDRIAIQAVFHTTIGKALFGLVVIRPQDGAYPSFKQLLAVWLFDVYLPIAVLGDGIGPDRPQDYFLPAVRRRDRRFSSAV